MCATGQHCTLLTEGVKFTKCAATYYLKDQVRDTSGYDTCVKCAAEIDTHHQSGLADGSGICVLCNTNMAECVKCTDVGDECLVCTTDYWPFDADEVCENNTCSKCEYGLFVDTYENPGSNSYRKIKKKKQINKTIIFTITYIQVLFFKTF